MVTLSAPKTLVFDLREPDGIEVSQLDILETVANDDLKYVRVLVRPTGGGTPPTWITLDSFSGEENYSGTKTESEVESALIEQLS
jgi:hypothetical protein